MSKSLLPMESFKLAEYAQQIPCYICSMDNSYDAEMCHWCQAPMALAHQANSQKLRPKMLAAIGASGVGKTVYLGMLLDMLSRQPQRMQILARGAFSITLQQTAIAALARREFPNKTPNEPDHWNWMHCQVTMPTRKHSAELIIPDMSGEAVLEEVDHPNTYRAIPAFLRHCSGILLLIDAVQLMEGSREQDYFSMKLLSYLSELDDDPKRGWKHRPVALIFTKADQVERCFDDPAAYAKQHAAGLWQHCRKRFRNHQFFASGVAGACSTRFVRGRGQITSPLRIEPRGIIEPFEWLVGQMNS
ncbi:MAG: hypothetical protein SGJ20_20685 [Planctomycetota bacterium]|nr:hypothetical protein [Planctomycetota bacterium]